MQKDLYLCFAHVPPVNSTCIAKHGNQLNDLESENIPLQHWVIILSEVISKLGHPILMIT